MKITRRQLRQIISEAMRDLNDPRGNIDRIRKIGVSKHGGPRPDHPFYTGDYDPAAEYLASLSREKEEEEEEDRHPLDTDGDGKLTISEMINEQEGEESDLTDEKQKEIDDAVADYLGAEGGAASEEGTEKIVKDKVDGIDAKAYLAKKDRFKQLKVGDDPKDYYDTSLAEIRKTIREVTASELKKK
jgi:hypothetical protein